MTYLSEVPELDTCNMDSNVVEYGKGQRWLLTSAVENVEKKHWDTT